MRDVQQDPVKVGLPLGSGEPAGGSGRERRRLEGKTVKASTLASTGESGPEKTSRTQLRKGRHRLGSDGEKYRVQGAIPTRCRHPRKWAPPCSPDAVHVYTPREVAPPCSLTPTCPRVYTPRCLGARTNQMDTLGSPVVVLRSQRGEVSKSPRSPSGLPPTRREDGVEVKVPWDLTRVHCPGSLVP